MRSIIGYSLLLISSMSFAADWSCTEKDLDKMVLGSDLYKICASRISEATYNDVKSDLIAIYTRYYEKTGDSVFHKKIEELKEFEDVAQKYNSLVCSLRSDITGYDPLPGDQCPESFWNEKSEILIPLIEHLIDVTPSKDDNPIFIDNFSPSFNCNSSKYVSEKIICKSDILSKIDTKLSNIYKVKIKKTVNKNIDDIKKDQILFLSKRNECTNWLCVRNMTIQRISELEELE